jgi:HlyD family secretion protein
MSSFRNSVFPILCLLAMLPALRAADAWPQTMRAHPEARLRVQTFARERQVILNPARWPQLLFLVPEGTLVKKGDLLIEFDMTGSAERLVSQEQKFKETEIRLGIRVAAQEDKVTALADKRSGLADEREVQRARQAFLKAMPRPEDVAIAKGRWDVARRNLDAATNQLALARDRFSRQLISPVALEAAETDNAMQEARTRFALARYRSAQAPAHPDDLGILAFRIANLDLEIDKLDLEIASQEEILAIERESAARELASLTTELEESREEMLHQRLFAPRDGVVLYTSRMKSELASGGKSPKGVGLLEIPDPASLAVKGTLAEDLRAVFKVGDPVEIRLNSHPGLVLRGVMDRMSPLPRDAMETDRGGVGQAQETTGVKVYDVEFTVEQPPSDLPFGVYGDVVLRTKEAWEVPAVPLSWIRSREGKSHLSLDGVLAPVQGLAVGPHYLLTGTEWTGKALGPEGTWPQDGDGLSSLDEGKVVASGELIPLESVAVLVPRLRSWDLKLNWLVPENTNVEVGDKIAELSSERISQQLREFRTEAQGAESDRRAAEEELAVKRREGSFKVAQAKNLLEIRRLELSLLEAGVSASAMQQARLNVESAEIQRLAAVRELERMRRSPETHSPAKIRDRERKLAFRDLDLEEAQMALAKAQAGQDEVVRSKARLELARQQARLAEIQQEVHMDISRAESTLRHRLRQETSRKERLRQTQADMNAMNVLAQAEGLVKYEKIWDGLGISRLRVGMSTWSGARMMSISSARRMVVRVQVPERYFHALREGMDVSVRIPSEGSREWKGRVRRVATLLEPAEKATIRAGLYANQEGDAEQVASVQVLMEDAPSETLKPGAVAHVIFPVPR